MGDKKQISKMSNNISPDVELYKQKIQTLLQAYKEQEDEKKRLQEIVEIIEAVTVNDDEVNKLKSMLAEGEKQRLKKEKILLADRKGLLDKYNESRKELKLIKEKIKQAGINIDEDNDISISFDKINNKYDKPTNKHEFTENSSLQSNSTNDTMHIKNLLNDTKKTFETDSKSLNKKIENLYKINSEKDSRISTLENANQISILKIAELANENALNLEKIAFLENEVEKMRFTTSQCKENSLVPEEEEKNKDKKKHQQEEIMINQNNINHTISAVINNDNLCQTPTSHKYPISEDKKLIRKDDLDSLLQQITNMTLDMNNIKSSIFSNLELFKKDINFLLFSLIDDANDLAKDMNKKHLLGVERLQKIIKEQREEIDLLKKYSDICKFKTQPLANVIVDNKTSLSRKSSTTTDLYSLINDKVYHQSEKKLSLTNTEETVLVQHYAEQLMKKEKILENVQKEFVLLEAKYNECLKVKLGAQIDYESQIYLLQDQIRDIRVSTKILQVNDFQYIRNIFISYLNTKSNDLISRRNILKALGQVLSLNNVDIHKIDTFK